MARGIRNAAEAERFLHPQFDHLHDPYSMLGMERAVARIQQAIAAQETILIYGDYDVDGTTAVVLLKTAIEMLGGEARFHVPHRLREGYGMQSGMLDAAARDGVRLVISVDTGIRAFAAAEAAEDAGAGPDRDRPSPAGSSHGAAEGAGDSESQPGGLRVCVQASVRRGRGVQAGAGAAGEDGIASGRGRRFCRHF